MKKQCITFETAKLAKEKDFPQPMLTNSTTFDAYHENGILWGYSSKGSDYEKDKYVYAPTQDVLHKWLREEHGMHVIVIPTVTAAWTFKTVTVLSKRDDDVIMGIKDVSEVPPYKGVNGFDYRTYEEALEAGLKESFKQIEVEDGN